MARVYERPRYINQARNKVLGLASATRDASLKHRVAAALQLSPADSWAARSYYDDLADLALDGEDIEEEMPGLSTQLEEYLLDAEIGRQASRARLTSPSSATKIVKDLMDTYDEISPSTILTDECAVFWLVHAALTDNSHHMESDMSVVARKRAFDLIHHQLAPQKVSPGAFFSVFSKSVLTSSPPPGYATAEAWSMCAEALLTRSHPMWVKYCRLWAAPPRRVSQRLGTMLDKVDNSRHSDRHRADTMGAVLPGSKCYNYAGAIFVYHKATLLILDPSACSYFRTCMVGLSNCTWSFAAYRVSGTTLRSNLTSELRRCIGWIAAAISDPGRARHVARHMHLAYTRWQNLTCEESAHINCGAAERDESLLKDMLDIYPHNTKWWDIVMSLGVPERVRAEFFKLYHLLPPPDIDQLLLHDTVIERTSTENKLDRQALHKFINFCKAYDFCRYTAKRRKAPSATTTGTYHYKDKQWFKKCLKGSLSMPPEDEWGQFKITKEFPYDHTADFHVLDAKDSTRVVADLGAYMDRSRSRDLGKIDQNELLSAIFNGATLSNGESARQWRDRVMSGGVTDNDHIIAAEAGKSENTKPGHKVRETLSAADTVREYLTEVDHSLRPLAALTPGVSIRVDMVKHKKKFQAMAHAVSTSSHQHAFATSTDITGWSPKMPREMFHAWQEYALSTTECPNPRGQIALWDRLVLFCDRRGTKRADRCKGGNIQGWPATSDTTMHAHILIYWAFKLRKSGILSRSEAAHVLCLIDDAATVVALEGTVEACEAKAKKAKDMLESTYRELGFEMDKVKSFFSAIKFVYLNELYIDGAQVMHATKTMMRIDKDFTRRFSSLTESIATAFGTAASASAQGADPFVAYFIAAMRSFMWAFSLSPELAREPGYITTAIGLAPVALNGLGIRPITSVMATGEADHLSWYIEVMGGLCSVIQSPRASKVFNNILGQRLATRGAKAVFTNPTTVVAETHRDAASAIRQAFREAARGKGLAEPFLTLDNMEHDSAFEDALEMILREGAYEATLLEEISASMPTALVDEVMARVDKTELVSYLLGPSGIATLRRRVRTCDEHNMEVMLEIVRGPDAASVEYDREWEKVGSFVVAKTIREENLLASGYQVLNHTYPCPFAMWAFGGQIDMDSQEARRLTTVSYSESRLRPTVGSGAVNLYDSVPSRPGYRGYRSLKSNVANEVRAVMYNPVRKKVARGLAAIRWAQSNGVCVQALSDLFLWCWAGEVDPRLATLQGKEVAGSAKRLSLRHSKTNHAIAIFHNCQSVVSVNAQAVTQYHAKVHPNGSTMYDMMAAITAMRCSGLLEAALCVRRGVASFEYGFRYKPTPVPIVESASELYQASPMEWIEKIKPFTMIPGEFGLSARAACSYRSMAKALDEYLDKGADAARRVFEAAMDEAQVDPDFAQSDVRAAEAVRVMTLAQRYSESAHIWEAHASRVAPQAIGAAAPIEVPRAITTTIAQDRPMLDFRSACREVANTWRDTMALGLVEADSKFAAQLARCAGSHDPDWEASVEDWATKSSLLKLRKAELASLVRDIQSFDSHQPQQECLSLFFRFFGIIGFHYVSEGSDDGEVLWQQANSFMGTVLYLDTAARAVGSRLRALKQASAEAYSSVTVASGRHSAQAVARVLRAQWRLASERRAMKANSLARQRASMAETTALNYESVFYRAAARVLKTTGRFSEDDWAAQVVSRVTDSLANHVESQSGRTDFVEDVSSKELDITDDLVSEELLIKRLMDVVRLAGTYARTADPSVVRESYTKVRANVISDVTGAHLAVPYRRTQVTVTSQGIAPATGTPDNRTALLPSLDSLIVSGMTIGAEGETEFECADPPEAVMWVFSDPGRLQAVGGTMEDMHTTYASITRSEGAYKEWVTEVIKKIDVSGFIAPSFVVFGRPLWEAGDDDGEIAV